MTRPNASCLCYGRGIWAAITAYGPTADQLVAAFIKDHNGPGHLLERPPRDWWGRHAAVCRRLEELATSTSTSGGRSRTSSAPARR